MLAKAVFALERVDSIFYPTGGGVAWVPPEGDFIRTCTPYGMLHKGEGLFAFIQNDIIIAHRLFFVGVAIAVAIGF